MGWRSEEEAREGEGHRGNVELWGWGGLNIFFEAGMPTKEGIFRVGGWGCIKFGPIRDSSVASCLAALSTQSAVDKAA